MQKTKRFFGHPIYAVASLILILLSIDSTRSFTQQVSQVAPDFALPDQSGKSYSLRDFRGKVILLDFWASWCGPCRMTMPHVQKWHEQYQDKGLRVIGVNIEGPSPRALNYLQNGKYNFMILFDQGNWNSQIAQLYSVRSIPQAFLIDRKGNVRFRGHPLQLSEEFLQEVLKGR
jgi:thiol-disulfide isomerase/thioredoxin